MWDISILYFVLFNIFVLIYRSDIPQQCLKNSVTEVSCASKDVRDSLLPHPDDCELFYYCVSPDHKPICRQCPANLHFNPSKNVCDQPQRAGCNVNIL